MTQSRQYPRYLTLKMGQITGEELVRDCAVLNVSRGGACVLVSDIESLPDTFSLSFDGDTRDCSIAWRERHRVGVAFTDGELDDNVLPDPQALRSAERGDDVLRVAELFLRGVHAYTEQQLELFDTVMHHLLDNTTDQAMAQLSVRIAPAQRAPVKVIHRLAEDDDIAVSGPVLERSPILAEDFLVRIARSKSQAHLLALAGRIMVPEKVTDVLVDRGDTAVTHRVAANDGAQISRGGFQRLAGRARQDEELAKHIVHRREVPADMFAALVRLVAEPVRQQLLRDPDPDVRRRMAQTMLQPAEPSEEAPTRGPARTRPTDKERDESLAQLRAKLSSAAKAGSLDETSEALARVTRVPVEAIRNLVRLGFEDGALVLCKAAGLGWPDAKIVFTVLMTRNARVDYKAAFERYLTFSGEATDRAVRYLKARKSPSTTEFRRML
ncbi:DUF2336 domain-containing protein [Rhodoplanes roseus]|uniref:PilZ domain-containing protein n=1 Tax=Rhodoplanes roseus TaxID=29409 RepID=A0A327L204_9BRAD|nr:DUF2336 domain-containing protein [Rhodoplanes roseus]RAI44979.1 hypothetical protein CH341_06400 [Rhodoplanes roseus]